MKILFILFIIIVFQLPNTSSFSFYLKSHNKRISQPKGLSSLSLTPAAIDVPLNLLKSSQLIAVAADYAAEIENAVGVEIYEPIFKAGLFIFFSGLVSSLVVAFIVSKSNTWEGLEDEFQKGKEAQFIELMGSSDEGSQNINESKEEGSIATSTNNEVDSASSSNNVDLRNLDI